LVPTSYDFAVLSGVVVADEVHGEQLLHAMVFGALGKIVDVLVWNPGPFQRLRWLFQLWEGT